MLLNMPQLGHTPPCSVVTSLSSPRLSMPKGCGQDMEHMLVCKAEARCSTTMNAGASGSGCLHRWSWSIDGAFNPRHTLKGRVHAEAYEHGVDYLQAFLWVDLVLSFVRAYRKPNGTIEYRPKEIRQRYMADKFVLDIAAAFPFVGLVILYGGEQHKFLAWLRLPRILSTWRLWAWSKKNQVCTLAGNQRAGLMYSSTVHGHGSNTCVSFA